MQADINNYVTESNKGNNITTEAVPVTVTTPELVPGGLGSDATAVSANSLRVSEIDQNAASRFDLARAVVVALARFRIHNKPRAFQARLRFCSSNASAASSPRPPQWNKST